MAANWVRTEGVNCLDSSLEPPAELAAHYGCPTLDFFVQTGDTTLDMLMTFAALRPDGKVLDAGCGVGRVAIPMTRFLGPGGAYEGFDVSAPGIEWCRTNISTRYANFQFTQVDVFNKMYNPQGQINPRDFRFPYDDDQFDVVHLGSVFTHMLPDDLKRYLSEIVRTMKMGGRCLITMFLINEHSADAIARGKVSPSFIHHCEGYRTVSLHLHEEAVAYAESTVREHYRSVGLEIIEPIHFGSWCGRVGVVHRQDYIVARKVGNTP